MGSAWYAAHGSNPRPAEVRVRVRPAEDPRDVSATQAFETYLRPYPTLGLARGPTLGLTLGLTLDQATAHERLTSNLRKRGEPPRVLGAAADAKAKGPIERKYAPEEVCHRLYHVT